MIIGGPGPNLNSIGRIGRTMFNKTLKNAFVGALTAKWTEVPVAAAGFEDANGQILDPATGKPIMPVPRSVAIPAFFDDAPNIDYKYIKWGVDAKQDMIACVPWDFPLPPTSATYYRAGRPDPYKLKQLIDKADIGIPVGGMLPEHAYQVLHLIQG